MPEVLQYYYLFIVLIKNFLVLIYKQFYSHQQMLQVLMITQKYVVFIRLYFIASLSGIFFVKKMNSLEFFF